MLAAVSKAAVQRARSVVRTGRTAAYVVALRDAGVFDAWHRQGVSPESIAAAAPFLAWAPPGHFYSPLPPLAEAMSRPVAESLPGIDVDADALLARLAEAMGHGVLEQRRYDPTNDQFGPLDATLVRSIVRSMKPKRWIEVGSGHSTAALLDATDDIMDRPIITTIDPHAARLRSTLLPGDLERINLIEEGVQGVPLATFEALEAGDVLFLDTTHVVRPGSDVVYEFLEVLPRLQAGVIVHIHDIMYPFEVPDSWIEEGRIWCEPYLLRALLCHSPRFSIHQWPGAVALLRPDAFYAVLPPSIEFVGTSLWLQVN